MILSVTPVPLNTQPSGPITRLEPRFAKNVTMPDESENALVTQLTAAFKSGDLATRNTLLTKLDESLRPVLRQALGKWFRIRQEDADDAIQDAFLTTLQKFAQFQGQTDKSLIAWISQIAKNSARMRFINRRKHGTVSLEDLPLPHSKTMTPEVDLRLRRTIDNPVELAAQKEFELAWPDIEDAVQAGLTGLSDAYRDPVKRHCLGGETFQTIAQDLGIKTDTCKTRVRRGKENLRIPLAPVWERYAALTGRKP